MSLQLIAGPSGSGKTHTLFTYALNEAKKHPELNYYVIVPEQFTLSTQRKLVDLSENHGILNVDVLSFARLSYRIFEEVGFNETSGIIMDDMGKNLVIRYLADKNSENLSVLSNNMKKLGYITEVKSLISEFKQYRIGDNELERMIDLSKEQGKGMLSRKLIDIKTLYDAFDMYIKDKYTTSEEILDLAARAAFKSDKLKKSVVLFDGFTGFTPVQYGLIESLLQISTDIYITLLEDGSDNITHNMEHELFYLSYDTENKLKKIAERNNICVNKKIKLGGDKIYRFADDKRRLKHLERNLFRGSKNPYNDAIGDTRDMKKPTKAVSDEIRVIAAFNPDEEIKKVATNIKNLVVNKGYRYKDIAIVTGDMEIYLPIINRIFKKYEIPVFADKKNPILLNPFSEYVRSIVEIISQNWAYEAVFRFIRSELNDYETYDIDVLENFVLEKGIKGYSAWKTDWVKKYGRNLKNDALSQLQRVEKIRLEVVENLEKLQNKITASDEKAEKIQTKTVNELNAEFYWFFEDNDIQNKLEKLSEAYSISDDIFASERKIEFLKVYRETIELMDKMSELLGDEVVSIKEYGDLIDAGFGEIRIGVIPSVTDYVQVGDVTRSRFSDIHTLFIVGANDGIIPKNNSGGGIISDIEKEFLIEYTGDIELSPSSRMKAYTSQLYLYMVMTKPDENLIISYPKLNMSSESIKPSYLIKNLKDLFPDIVIENSPLDIYELIYNKETGFKALTENISDVDSVKELLPYYKEDADYSSRLNKVIDAYLSEGVNEGADSISRAVSNVLYGNALKGSVTRLERFAECSYRYFLEYGLKLKERQLFDFEAKDMGTLFHGALENYSKLVSKNEESWILVDETKKDSYIEEAIEMSLNDGDYSVLYSSFRNKYMVSRIKRILKRSVNVLTEHLKAGKLQPIEAEVEFSSVSNLKAFNFMLSDTERMHLSGKIDRIDTYEDNEHVFVKIIDYKSGDKSLNLMEVYKGLSLQLVVYMNAAMEMISEKTDKTVVPAGILYYHIDDPLVDVKSNESDEEIAEKIYSELKMKGLVNSDEDVYRLIDGDFENKSDIIPISINKDGSFSKWSTVVSNDDFSVISDFVTKKLKENGKRILDGEIEALPHSDKGVDDKKCEYCPYKVACKYVPGTVNDDEADIPTASNEEIIELMKQELQ